MEFTIHLVSSKSTSKFIVLFWAMLLISASRLWADWPEHRGNCQRTGYLEQPLESKHWQPSWQLKTLSPPEPAWPEPAQGSLWQKLDHIEARVTDDQADVPLIVLDAQGHSHVLLTSSANDRLIAVDPLTGEIEWQYVTRGPVRYAPSTHAGIAYLGADDGIVRAIDISSGQERWQSRIGPTMPWIVGNGRLISPHPIRSSVLVQGNHVYATVGLFPSQGVYAVALDSETGGIVWRRKIKQSPQGYLLADDHKLFVPTGRTQPFALSRSDGRFLHELPSPGGSFCMLTPEAFFAGPGNDATVQASGSETGAKMLSFQGKQVVAGGGQIWTANGEKLASHRLSSVSDTPTPTWSVDCQLDQSLIVTGPKQGLTLFVAGGSEIHYLDAAQGKSLGTLSLEDSKEQIKYLAVSQMTEPGHELLVASTRSGNVYAWRGVSSIASQAWPQPPEPTRLPTLATRSDLEKTHQLAEQLKSTKGFALLLEDNRGGLTEALLTQTEMRVVSFVSQSQTARRLQIAFQERGWYGHRVSVWHLPHQDALPVSAGLFNALVELDDTGRSTEELQRVIAPQTGLLWRSKKDKPTRAPTPAGTGLWRHQYANPSNTADSEDNFVGNAAAFRLLWFGGVGPRRMPDRHLRGPAPLSTGATMVMQGDEILIGVDPANGTERWQLPMPNKSMRYVTPFDSGYVSLTEDGSKLFVAANKDLWQVDAYTGKILNTTPLAANDQQWGYVAESANRIYVTHMKTTAGRTANDLKTRYTYVDSDYRSERPLVTSRRLQCLEHNGTNAWSYVPKGVILNSTIALDEQQIVFVEARSADSVQHETDRIPLQTLLQDAYLVSLQPRTGKLDWEQPLNWPGARNVLHVQLAHQKVVLTSSKSEEHHATYLIRILSSSDGSLIWKTEHRHVRQGLFHGEQVHHPVALHRPGGVILVAEPYFYDLETGERSVPEGASADWALRRPGHSCGTLSGAGDCLFFRAGNPTVLNIATGTFSALSPTRPGCWINMIPAGGRLLIPEASASCVCNYSLQTSMAFSPVMADDVAAALPTLPDISPAISQPDEK